MSVTYTGFRKKGRNERFEVICFSNLNTIYNRFQHIVYYPKFNVDEKTAKKFLASFYEECPPDIQARFKVGCQRGIPYVKVNTKALSSLQTLFILTIARMLDEDVNCVLYSLNDKTTNRSFWEKLVLNVNEAGTHSIMNHMARVTKEDDKKFRTKIEPLSVIFAKMKGIRWNHLVQGKSLHGQFAFNQICIQPEEE